MTREEIKAEYSMRDVLARYGLSPNRAGFISCPFHDGDRQASMKIYGKDYNCFGCGANGDVFDFIQAMEQVSFLEAFRILGGTYIKESPIAARMRAASAVKQREARDRGERKFRAWRKKRLNEVCIHLRLLEQILPSLTPLSATWAVAVDMREVARYKYMILASGTKEEQERMMELDE